MGLSEGDADAVAKALARIVGDSLETVKLRALIAQVARTDLYSHIVGPTGVGKGLVAQVLHLLSPRAPRPFISVNCGALTPELGPSDLFGHEKGAFTGAIAARKGYLELAADGTLFLDEAGDMHGRVQATLLKAIEDGWFEPVGGLRRIQFRARIITATNMDLKQLIAGGLFRADLYFRLCQHVINIRPLCKRHEDVVALANVFVKETAATGISRDALCLLKRYSWPGNVRELRSVIRSLGDVECRGTEIGAMNVRRSLALDMTEREWLIELLRDSRGNVTEVARRVGMRRESLHRKLKALGIAPGTGRTG